MSGILVVNDNIQSLQSMVSELTAISPTPAVSTARNFAQAVSALQKNGIHLLVIDLAMPENNGFQLLAHVLEHYPDVGVVVSTDQPLPPTQNESLSQAGMVILDNPLDTKEILHKVTQLLERQTDGGTLNNVSPGTFMQLINLEQKTCTLRLEDKNTGKLGVLFFRDGRILDARTGEQRGEAASLDIFSWEDISLAIENNCQVQKVRIERSLDALILEATRLKDEKIAEGARGEPDQNEQCNKKIKAAQIEPGLKEFINNSYPDPRWTPVLEQLSLAGKVLQIGNLSALSMASEGEKQYLIIPSAPPTVLAVDIRCPKDKLYEFFR